MLHAKKLLTKILKWKPLFEYVGNYGSAVFNTSWTATDDGIAVIIAQWNTNSSIGYWYVQDETVSLEIGCVHINSANGCRNAVTIPIIKGHKYSSTAKAAVASAEFRFYRMKLGGGYSLKVFSVLSRLVRGWEYAKHKESTYEDSHLYGRADESSSRRFLHNINSSESRNMEVCIGNNSIGVHSALLQDIWCKPRLDKHYKYIDIRFRQHFDNRLFLPEYHKRSNKLFSWWRCNPGENIVAYSNTSGRGCSYA